VRTSVKVRSTGEGVEGMQRADCEQPLMALENSYVPAAISMWLNEPPANAVVS